MAATGSLDAVLRADPGADLDSSTAQALLEAILQLSAAASSLSTALARPGAGHGLREPIAPAPPSQGEHSALDQVADDLFLAAARRSNVRCYLSQTRSVARSVAQSAVGAPRRLHPAGRIDLTATPLEGSLDLEVNAAVGTLFSFFAARPEDEPETAFGRPGREQIAAGFFLYGPNTTLVVTTGAGTHVFQLDRDEQCFVLVRPSLIIPKDAAAPSVPASDQRPWEGAGGPGLIEHADAPGGKISSGRTPASLVAECYRVFIRGGIFLHAPNAPPDNPEGGLRLVCEANPLALLAQQAGGAASDGQQPILDLPVESSDQRTPFLMGSSERVEHLRRHPLGSASSASRLPLFGRRGLLRT